MSGTLRFTLLGSGSSAGTPRIGGDWGICDPKEPRNARTRSGLLVQQWAGPPGDPLTATTVLVDTSPDLRSQLLAAKVRHVDGVLYSHDHADQVHGIDDMRAFYITHRKRVPVWMTDETRETLQRRFGYCFAGAGGYPAILDDVGGLTPGVEVSVPGPGGPIRALPMLQHHGAVNSLGFRFGPGAYNNDVVSMPEESFAALDGLKLWIVDALQRKPHVSHAHLGLTLEWIARLGPARAVLTNMHIDMDYQTLRAELPGGVEPGYDGLAIDIPVPAESA
jgi:phosphoribosyl 1,2-cyclic phosphate phosphodiesterase